MTPKSNDCSRREFFKVTGAAGVGVLLGPLAANARSEEKGSALLAAAGQSRVPTRPFGKTGTRVSTLALGGMFDIGANQIMLRQALNWGVTYWDTADCYGNGESETGFGKYFAKYPEDREKVFLVTKSDARDPEGMSRLLARSLQRLNTPYINLYFIHGVKSMDELNDDTRRWVEKAKVDGKIKLFGFSTHKNMEELLTRAAALGYIDGIMLSYNFRIMHTQAMKNAVDACVQAGIGLTAMKTQGGRSWLKSDPADKVATELMESFIQKGLTEQQAKLKAVWTNPNIASICSQMPDMTLLKANVAAAADTTLLTSREMLLFEQYALETADQYCAGCGHICETAVNGCVPIGDIMRYHMYEKSYGRLDWARTYFRDLGAEVHQSMAQIDFSAAEQCCPQKMPIASLMKRALMDFA
ncbi:MAG: aldo/keto reductase [Desulfobacterales bacterium]|jgi:predicted aldo/keto reductase-like oxidoreductase|nr:aldo/keto reductase [Desulfobacterales bacterium]